MINQSNRRVGRVPVIESASAPWCLAARFDLPFRLGSLNAVAFLNPTDELFGTALDDVEIVAGELSPLLPGLTLELRPLSLQRSSFVTSSTVRSRLRFARSRAVQRTESPVSSCPVYADSAACRRGVINLETNCVTGSSASNARGRPSSARAVVALEVLVEQDEVAPMRIVLELLRSTECRTLS